MKIGYLGPKGTYTQQASEGLTAKLGLTDVERLPLDSIDIVLDSLYQGEIDGAVVPLKNTLAGNYMETVNGIERYGFEQRDSILLQIRLVLGIHPTASESQVREIRSKDTALRECGEYLKKNYPNARLVEVESTATAMKSIMEQNLTDVAAIGSETGMRLYGLRIVNADVGDKKDNFTTFLYLERRGS